MNIDFIDVEYIRDIPVKECVICNDSFDTFQFTCAGCLESICLECNKGYKNEVCPCCRRDNSQNERDLQRLLNPSAAHVPTDSEYSDSEDSDSDSVRPAAPRVAQPVRYRYRFDCGRGCRFEYQRRCKSAVRILNNCRCKKHRRLIIELQYSENLKKN